MKNSGGRLKRILLVEDEPVVCTACQTILVSEGFEVDIAVNGKVAQDMIKKKHYDLCLIDIRTPAMNGKELYSWLKEKGLELTRGVIFTTGDVMGGDTQSFLKQAARPFLPKPFTSGELKAIVQEPLKQIEK